VLYAKIERFWKNGRKRGGLSSSCGAFSGLKLTRNGTARNMGYGASNRSEIRMPCCPRSVDATCRRTNLRSSLPSSIAPAKLAVCAVFAVLPSNFKRPYLFNRLADLGEFYVESKGFPCSTQKSSNFGRMDEKKRGLSSSCGAFSGLKLPGMALLVTWGTGLRPERDSHAMLSSFGRCYMQKDESPFKFTFVYRPRKAWLFVPFFAVLPSNFKRPYLFKRLADLGEFYVESKGFPCSYAKIERFWKNGRKKEGPFFLMWGLFRAKITENGTARNMGYGLRAGARFACHVVLVR